MLIENVIDSTTCWTKNKSNCAHVLSSIIVADKKESATTMSDKTFAQFDLFLAQECNSIYNSYSTVVTTCALGCYSKKNLQP
jgi:hypothetical protein